MFLNLIGCNYQNLLDYIMAEHYLIRSTHSLPDRMYPPIYWPDVCKFIKVQPPEIRDSVQSHYVNESRNQISCH